MASQLLDFFSASADIRFDLVTANYSSSVLGSGSVTVSTICPVKLPGLHFTLNTSQLNIPQLNGLNLAIPFTGQDAGFNGTEQRILWTSDQKNLSKPIPGSPATLDSLQIQFTSILTSLGVDVKSKDCAGFDIFYSSLLQTDGLGQVDMKGHAPGPFGDVSIDVGGTITFEGVFGAPHSLAVKILNQGSFCANPPIAGGQGASTAYVSGVPVDTVPSYKWIVQGAAIVGADDQWKVRYTLPNLNGITISVGVTAGDQAATATTKVFPIAAGIARLETIICELRTEVIVNYWFNPLIDPVVSNVARLANPAELQRLAQTAMKIERLATQIQQMVKELSRAKEE